MDQYTVEQRHKMWCFAQKRAAEDIAGARIPDPDGSKTQKQARFLLAHQDLWVPLLDL